MKKLLLLLASVQIVFAGIVVTGDDYSITTNDSDLELIFTKEHSKEAKKTKSITKEVIKKYEKSYGYTLDDTLYLGLASSHNQIANAFSTQFPLNSQINYIGGAYMVDYMSSTSWLKTLLLHESAHNFQLNAKKNLLSRYAHKVVKNLPFTSLLFIPIFPVPNSLESSFLLEGNAVFNESRYNNGGRLYNGAHLAMAITQAKAGLITPKRSYNSHLYFPYNTHHYIIGGFFQLFLAKKYGVDKVNKYFWNFSGQYLPVQTNAIFKKSFGKSFEEEIEAYSDWMQSNYKEFQVSKGELLTTSKRHKKLNDTKDEIHFLTSDSLSKPKLFILNKNDGKIKSKQENFLFGNVFKIDNTYYTTSSRNTEVQKIEMGLYDKNAKIYNKSSSKIIQRILPDGKFLYFDAKSSFNEPKLFIDDNFYDTVNSSVYSDYKGDIYYFKQDGKKRTLYKNKKALFSYLGWYGFVVDAKDGEIIFIANSKNGSTLYSYDGEIKRLALGDDIVDAKLLSDKTVLLVTIASDGYNYIKSPLIEEKAKIYETKLFFENREDFNFSYEDLSSSFKSRKYKSFQNLHYSSLSHELIINDDKEVDFSVNIKFADPLVQNTLSVYIQKYDDTIIGASYSNSAYRLKYGGSLYGVLQEDENTASRGYGTNIFLNYPIYNAGYTKIDTNLNYHLSHEKDERKPLSLSIDYTNNKHFGKSMYQNAYNRFSFFTVQDRGDNILGFNYKNLYNLWSKVYGVFSLKYAKSNTNHTDAKRGIKIDDNPFSQTDPSKFFMPTLKYDLYLKDILKTSLGVKYVLNLDAYFFTFPISLKREAIYIKYNYYDITSLKKNGYTFNEYILGISFDLLFLHNNTIPLTFEYLQNQDLKEPNRFKILFNLPI